MLDSDEWFGFGTQLWGRPPDFKAPDRLPQTLKNAKAPLDSLCAAIDFVSTSIPEEASFV
jgi:hypothetical protein